MWDMPVAFPSFNPFDPFGIFSSSTKASTQPTAAAPIAIKAESGDPGVRVTSAHDSVTIRGRAEGAAVKYDLSGAVDYEIARGMSFTLDIDKAKTTDAFGHDDFTEKNARLFTLDTQRGWSAAECARRLAAKVNDGRAPFFADVRENKDGSATIVLSRE